MSKVQAIANIARPLTIGGLRAGAVQLTVARRVKAEQVHAALDKIFELHGCLPCGLNGLDIVFRHSTPLNDAFKGFEGIEAVEQFGY
ncbi:MAG: hypothetical protein AAFZ15_13270 [Bacteroidota bacterium]